VRKRLAQLLRERGRSLSEIARVLGVSKAAVSQYLKGKRGGELSPWMEEIVKEYSERDCVDLLELLYRITRDPRFGGWNCG